MKKIYTTTEWFAPFILFLIWFSMQAFLFYVNGIKTDGEGISRIIEAKRLLEGVGLRGYSSYMYLTETLLIFLSFKLKVGYVFVIVIQLMINLFAVFTFCNYLNFLYKNKILALAGSCLLLFCPYYQIYNTYLYTESIFFSLSIIYSCFLMRNKVLTIKNIVIITIFLVLLCLTRPTGIFFLAATLVYLFFFLSSKINVYLKISFFILSLFFTLFFLNLLMGSGGAIDIMLPFKQEMIICEVPTLSSNADINTLLNANSLNGLIYYITHNSSQFFRLAILKSKAFFGLMRPYYSKSHNLFLVVYFYSFYVLIILTIVKFYKELPKSFIYFISIIGIYWISVIFSCDEWHNRFFLTLTPFFITMSLYFFKRKTPYSSVRYKMKFHTMGTI